jgi:hypothetical protein
VSGLPELPHTCGFHLVLLQEFSCSYSHVETGWRLLLIDSLLHVHRDSTAWLHSWLLGCPAVSHQLLASVITKPRELSHWTPHNSHVSDTTLEASGFIFSYLTL